MIILTSGKGKNFPPPTEKNLPLNVTSRHKFHLETLMALPAAIQDANRPFATGYPGDGVGQDVRTSKQEVVGSNPTQERLLSFLS